MVIEDLAQQYREAHGKVGAGGVVVLYDGEICGWVDKLRNPEHWRHGAIAIDEQGAKWAAVGTADIQNGVPGADDTACTWFPLPGNPLRAKRGPGRPSKSDSMSGADRQAAYRARKKAEGVEEATVQLDADVLAALRKYVDKQNKDVADGRMTLGDALNKIVRDRLLRPR